MCRSHLGDRHIAARSPAAAPAKSMSLMDAPHRHMTSRGARMLSRRASPAAALALLGALCASLFAGVAPASASSWTLQSPSGPPAQRAAAGMAYDAASTVDVAFGGVFPGTSTWGSAAPIDPGGV